MKVIRTKKFPNTTKTDLHFNEFLRVADTEFSSNSTYFLTNKSKSFVIDGCAGYRHGKAYIQAIFLVSFPV